MTKVKGITHYKNSPGEPECLEMLRESNYIENERSQIAMNDAMEAWKYAVRNSGNITTKYILKIHKLLLRNLRPEIAGKFRDCDVYIGGRECPYISDEIILSQMKDVLRQMDTYRIDKKNLCGGELEQKAMDTHISFEHAHPFVDGNGRVGRILYNIHRLKLGLDLHIIHEGDEQRAYYSWFRK